MLRDIPYLLIVLVERGWLIRRSQRILDQVVGIDGGMLDMLNTANGISGERT